MAHLRLLLLSALVLAGCAGAPAGPTGPIPMPETTENTTLPQGPSDPMPATGIWIHGQEGVPPWWRGYQENPSNQSVRLDLTLIGTPATERDTGRVLATATVRNQGGFAVNLTSWDACSTEVVFFAWITPAGDETYDPFGEGGACTYSGPERPYPTLKPLAPNATYTSTFVFRGRLDYSRYPDGEVEAVPGANYTMTVHACWSVDGIDSGCAARYATFTWPPPNEGPIPPTDRR